MVPNGWKYVYLGDVITHKKGFAFNSSLYRNKGIRIVRISDTTRNSVHSENPVYLDKDDASGLDQYILNKDDIILSTVGSRPHLLDSMVGKAVKVPIEAAGSLLNQNLVKITPESSKIINEYLYEMIKNKKFIFFISTLVRGNANQVSITLADLFQYEFLLPPLPEQRKIAAILSTWDKAISTTEQLLANSQQQKKALMQQLLTGKKRLLDEKGERFTGEWKNHLLGAIVEITTSTSKSAFVSESGHNFIIDMGSVSREGKLIPSKRTTLESDFLEIGQLVMPKDDIGGGNIIGRVGLILESKKYVLADHVYALKVLNNDSVFISYLINSNIVNNSLRRRANGTAQLGLGKKDVQKQVLHMPTSVEEQQKIAAALTTADQEIEALRCKVEAFKQEKKALMQQLLTGKSRVKT